MISSSQRTLPDYTKHSQETDIHVPRGIQTHILSRRAAEDLRLRPRCHWDWPETYYHTQTFPPLALPCARYCQFLSSYPLHQESTEAFLVHILLGITEVFFHQVFLLLFNRSIYLFIPMNFTLRAMCVCVFAHALRIFSFCGATAQIGPRTPHFEVSVSRTVTTHTR